ncbi:hypothetical protein JCM18899A_44710 [Nocardioides sp. AN3]
MVWGGAVVTLTANIATCDTPDRHEWALRSIEFEDVGSVRVFECQLCGRVDHRGAGP